MLDLEAQQLKGLEHTTLTLDALPMRESEQEMVEELDRTNEIKIEPVELTEAQIALKTQHFANWRAMGLRTEPIEKGRFRDAINRFYKTHKLREPKVLWLNNPWEVTAMFSLLHFIRGHAQFIPGQAYRYIDKPQPLQKWVEPWLRATLTSPFWAPVWKVFDEHRWCLELHDPLAWEPAGTANDKLYYPMFSECSDAIEVFQKHFVEEEWNELWNEAESTVEWVLRTGIERPLKRFVADDFEVYGRKLLKVLDSQLRSQYLTEEDFETLKSFRTANGGSRKSLERLAKELEDGRFTPSLNAQRLARMRTYVDAVLKQLSSFDDLKFFVWQNSSPVLISLVSELLPSEFQLDLESAARHDIIKDLMESSFAFLPFGMFVLASERPTVIHLDHWDRLHCETGPALAFEGGLNLYYWHGIRVPCWLINDPNSVSVQAIQSEKNVEIRTVMIEKYGESKFLMDSGAKIFHEDEFGTLYKKDVDDQFTLAMVKVTNSTENPDGTKTTYFLRVPDDVATAKEAVAWTFGLRPDDYNPLAES